VVWWTSFVWAATVAMTTTVVGGCLVGKIFWRNATVAVSLLFGKYCPIMVQLGLKDLSRPFRLNCVISFIFYLYLMLHAYVQRFDVTVNDI
jgi:hypothetical protein